VARFEDIGQGWPGLKIQTTGGDIVRFRPGVASFEDIGQMWPALKT
jgi:hypothetical protein